MSKAPPEKPASKCTPEFNRFCADVLETGDPTCSIEPTPVFRLWSDWCERRGLDPGSQKRFGGMMDRSGRSEVPSGKANAGQKLLFWLMVVLVGITASVTGLILDFPNFDQTRQTMQIANGIHMIAGVGGAILLAFHIYLGTVGMRGAYDAMRHGYVDETWAKQHHRLWYDDVMSGRASHGGRPVKVTEPGRDVV